MNEPVLWKVNCMERQFPGMWQRWFKHQCVAVGWPEQSIDYNSGDDPSWAAARNAVVEMAIGDYVVVALHGHRVGRLGQITGKAIQDNQWDPLVPPGKGYPRGEMGRRIFVRWDLTIGPDNRDLVVQLGEGKTFTSGELRASARKIKSMSLSALKAEMSDPNNWVNLLGFRYEKALSDYIANYPNRLEDGLLPHPNKKIRELAFPDGTRLDVLLIDQNENPVIVECKQHAPGIADVRQLRGYMKHLKAETKEDPRGILVHGGAAKLSSAVIAEALNPPSIEIVSYGLEVSFKPSIEVGFQAR